MSRVLAVCQPGSDAGFGERVRGVVAEDRWDLDSPEGIALIQAALRQTYAMATVVCHDGVWAGGQRRTVVLDVYRDGLPGAADVALRWIQAVYELSGARAYRLASSVLGDGAGAERAVEQAFRELSSSVADGLSVAAGGVVVETASLRLANEARVAEGSAPSETLVKPLATAALADTSVQRRAVRTVLSGSAVSWLPSSQREALELSVLEDLKVKAIAARMQTTPSTVHSHLRDALLAVGAGIAPTAAQTLARWRDAQRSWGQLPEDHPARQAASIDVAHTWIDYQVASGAVQPETVVLVTDAHRRFVTASANAAGTLGRSSLVGLQIDDVTADYARPLVPELWTLFDANGGMSGEYDCDRPGQAPLRIPFRGIWGRPLPDLQVGYLQPPLSPPTGLSAPG